MVRPMAKDIRIYFEGFGWHTFRRQNLTEVGATPFEGMAEAGHSRPVMTSENTVIGLDRRGRSGAEVARSDLPFLRELCGNLSNERSVGETVSL